MPSCVVDYHGTRLMPASSPPGQQSPSGPFGPASAGAGVRRLVVLNTALLGTLGVGLCLYLWPQWRHNPDLSHGLFMPLICAVLLQESKRHGGMRHPRPGLLTVTGVGLLAAAGVGCLAAAGLFAVSLGWTQSLVGFMLAGAFVCSLLSAAVALSVEPLQIVPLNWCVFSAAALWLLVAPMPPGTYATLTTHLQIWVTRNVISSLSLLGIAARQHGNLIELAHTTVGIEESCSGVRSLISCVFAGSFLSAFLLRRPWTRALLIAVSAPLALAMNVVRSLTLTLLANAGVSLGGFWHDATGFAVLGLTTAILIGLAMFLEPRGHPPPPESATPVPGAGAISRPALWLTQLAITAGLLLAAALTTFFIVQTRPRSPTLPPSPDLAALLPATPSGWSVSTATDLDRFSGVLQTDHLIRRTYFKGTADRFTSISVYVAYWPPGRTSVSTVAMHTPDACWPGVGWMPVASASARFTPTVCGRVLPPAESRLFRNQDLSQHVWFWQIYDGAPIPPHDPRSPRELLASALRYGFRQDSAQMFIQVSSNQPWNAIADEPLLADIFDHLHGFGL